MSRRLRFISLTTNQQLIVNNALLLALSQLLLLCDSQVRLEKGQHGVLMGTPHRPFYRLSEHPFLSPPNKI